MTKTRIPNDVYPTESGIIDKLADIMPALFYYKSYFEPCAGNSDLVKAIAPHILPDATIETADLFSGVDSDHTYHHFDATHPMHWSKLHKKFDVIITNPPFSDAPAIATQCWQYTRRYLVLILRLSFLEQCSNRREFWEATQDHLVMIAPINPRPRFRSDTKGNDSVTCCVFVWDKMRSWKEMDLRSPYQMITDWRK